MSKQSSSRSATRPRVLSAGREQSLFPRVVFGIDFGPASLSAARWAVANVSPSPVATLSHVVPVGDSPAEYDGTDANTADARHLLPALVGGLGGFAATLNLASVRTVLRVGTPSRWLSTIATDVQASLLVLGRRGDSNRRGLGEPNVVERLARRATAAVLVVPEGITQPLRHVVAAVDQSRFGAHVLRVARWLAGLHQSPLTILHALAPIAGTYDRVIRNAQRIAGGKVAPPHESPLAPGAPSLQPPLWLSELASSEGVADRESVELTVGDPTRQTVAAALRLGSALVVVGQRGADDAPSGALGSVARELLTRAPMPVLAVTDSSRLVPT